MRKTLAIALMLTASLGLAACDKKSEDKAQDANQHAEQAQQKMNEAQDKVNEAAKKTPKQPKIRLNRAKQRLKKLPRKPLLKPTNPVLVQQKESPPSAGFTLSGITSKPTGCEKSD